MLLWRSLLVALCLPMAAGGYTSLYVFGDGVCTTTDNPTGPGEENEALADLYYGRRYCNGRVWVEVLAQWQGLTYDPAGNISYFGHDSTELIANANNFVAPADVATALVVAWTNNADLVEFSTENPPPYGPTDLPAWNQFVEDSLAEHEQALNILYNKGVRHLVMPKAVDITSVPFYNLAPPQRQFIRERVIEFNTGFDAMLVDLMVTLPGLRICRPDTFAFFETVLANPGDYGLVNPGVDAINDLGDPPLDSGPGVDYIFWDVYHPTAKFQVHLANLVQQLLTPARLHNVVVGGGNADLTVVNAPVGREGFVDSSPDVINFSEVSPILPTATSETFSVPATGDRRFYKVRFPVVWSWP
ncbi:MAG: hypothetical protein HKN82_15535 [Akkermansiaceae bacterium]|nr:hypothetical protein [Akkermansiaceae bacterium]